jgi:hypothetical protein
LLLLGQSVRRRIAGHLVGVSATIMPWRPEDRGAASARRRAPRRSRSGRSSASGGPGSKPETKSRLALCPGAPREFLNLRDPISAEQEARDRMVGFIERLLTD